MADAATELARRGRALGAKDRGRLVDLLPDSPIDAPAPEVEEAWRLELRRRIASDESGGTTLHDADDVMAEAKRLAP